MFERIKKLLKRSDEVPAKTRKAKRRPSQKRQLAKAVKSLKVKKANVVRADPNNPEIQRNLRIIERTAAARRQIGRGHGRTVARSTRFFLNDDDTVTPVW